MQRTNKTVNNDPERPPLFSTWPRMYAAVLAFQALLITLFYLFTKVMR